MRRRPTNLKFHAIAIAIICVVITILYTIINPKPADESGQPLASGDRYIRIDSATWGANCNETLDKLVADHANKYIGDLKDAGPAPQRVESNNVLPAISRQCDGRLQCQMPLSSETLGVEPLTSCYKRLTLSYRCFTIDRLWNVDLAQGTALQLDCRTEADTTRQ